MRLPNIAIIILILLISACGVPASTGPDDSTRAKFMKALGCIPILDRSAPYFLEAYGESQVLTDKIRKGEPITIEDLDAIIEVIRAGKKYNDCVRPPVAKTVKTL